MSTVCSFVLVFKRWNRRSKSNSKYQFRNRFLYWMAASYSTMIIFKCAWRSAILELEQSVSSFSFRAKDRKDSRFQEENPIYLLDKSHLESARACRIATTLTEIPSIQENLIDKWKSMSPTYETIVQRADTALVRFRSIRPDDCSSFFSHLRTTSNTRKFSSNRVID